jgi:hypothetical protein
LLCEGDGDGLGDGLGDGDGDGDGEGLGDGDGEVLGEGLGEGDGIPPLGCVLYPVKLGVGKTAGGAFASAWVMKSCQISAGIVPPNTSGTPSTLTIDVLSFFG